MASCIHIDGESQLGGESSFFVNWPVKHNHPKRIKTDSENAQNTPMSLRDDPELVHLPILPSQMISVARKAANNDSSVPVIGGDPQTLLSSDIKCIDRNLWVSIL